MNTESKNQHFVPKFYLGKFSINKNEREIRVYVIRSGKFIAKASVRGQAAQAFYYGKDGILEKAFVQSEGRWAEALRQCENKHTLGKSSKLYHELLDFIVTTDLRNPKRKNLEQFLIEKNANEFRTKLLSGQLSRVPMQYQSVANKSVDSWVSERMTQAVERMLKRVGNVRKIASDLKLVVVKNTTEIPFVTSDYPIILHNQFFEKNCTVNIGTAYASLGCQIFCPISDQLLLFFFDGKIYDVGKYTGFLNAKNDDVDQLNKLQMLNCSHVIYGNERMTENYCRSLYDVSQASATPKQPLVLSFVTLSKYGMKTIVRSSKKAVRKNSLQIIKTLRRSKF